MKHLLFILSTVFLIYGCSGQSNQQSDQITSDISSEASEGNVVNEDTAPDEVKEDAENDESESEASEGADDENKDSEDDIAGLDQKNVKLVVKNQTTAGQIVVEQVATSRDGWVSVHKSGEDGGIQLPDSIGEARVDSGDSEDVIIDLWEAPDIDEKLWVLLHIDAGERGRYEFPGKDQAVRKNGETMARSFVIQDPNPDKDEDDAEDE